jgi:hypothetical protein
MIFPQLRSTRMTHSVELRHEGETLPTIDIVECDGNNGFDVTLLDVTTCDDNITKHNDGDDQKGKVKKFGRFGNRNSSSQNRTKGRRCPTNQKRMSPDMFNDTLSTMATLSTRSSSNDIRREVARYCLTSLLSEDEATMGPHTKEYTDAKINQEQQHPTYQSIMFKTEKERNILKNSLLQSYSSDDTVFDGVVDAYTPMTNNRPSQF